MHWFPQCIKTEALDWLADDWKCDILRMAVYMDAEEDGWEEFPEPVTSLINTTVDECEKRGMYCIIDDHIINPGDPMLNIEPSMQFFDIMAKEHANKPHVIYEICNEPNFGATWEGIHQYADSMIKVIRKYDSANIIVIGSPGYSSLGDGSWPYLVDNPIQGNNLMYTYHFYAGSHGDGHRSVFTEASKVLPLFVTEFGIQAASGDGPCDTVATRLWMDLCDEKKVSWCNWSFSDMPASSGILKSGTCYGTDFNESVLNPDGLGWIYNEVRKPDNFEIGTGVVRRAAVSSSSPKFITVQNSADSWLIKSPDAMQATVRDVSGKTVAVINALKPGMFMLDKSGIAPGMKIISVKSGGKVITKKVVLR
jgi:endoglucanase